MVAILSILSEILDVLSKGNTVLATVFGFPPIDVVVIIFLVSLVGALLKPRTKESNHALYLSLVCFLISIIHGVVFYSVDGYKEAVVIGFRLASISTLTYNVLKPIFKPLVRRFYSWLRTKGVEVKDVR